MANPTGKQQSGAAAQVALAKNGPSRRAEEAKSAAAPLKKPSGYGLPCSKCHLYYPADLDRCPTCQTSDRVAPAVPKALPKLPQNVPQPDANTSAVEHEREEFLRQFKLQLKEAHAAGDTAKSVCRLTEHHAGELAPAEICGPCYERLQERVETLEASLRIDLNDAVQIVYEAVWADSSDPSKTYQNAASALLTELRKRAGISIAAKPFQPQSD